ncbi:hypothetical protein KSP39_PZI017682 [Platanthera zijinensis]|uniref:Uncharacterized protein n=1 Tax=Platanthera zijinensis TaxID=2320716 RepID=A0AAP0FZL4_9ASPA
MTMTPDGQQASLGIFRRHNLPALASWSASEEEPLGRHRWKLTISNLCALGVVKSTIASLSSLAGSLIE